MTKIHKKDRKTMLRIGVDLGGTNIAAGIVNENYEIVCKLSRPTELSSGDSIAKEIGELCNELCEKYNVKPSDIEAVGIASPGIVDHDKGIVVYSCNLPFLNYPLTDKVGEFFPNNNIHAENDANAAAWGEAVAGVAKGASSSIMITLGTGVGGGIVIDNKILSGFNYAGAELGHIVIRFGGERCGCGRQGCWESYSSATALIRMTREKIEECEMYGFPTMMAEWERRHGKISGKTAFQCAKEGDKFATQVVDKYVRYLASGITNITNIFQPEVISIGGGISNEGDYLLEKLLPYIKKEAYGQGIVKLSEIKIASLKNDAGIVGSALLGIER